MMYFPSLLAVVPDTFSWSPKVALVMVICNVIAIAGGKFGIKYQSVGPQMPAPEFFGGMSFPTMLAVTSLGHILGAGAILGLASVGVL